MRKLPSTSVAAALTGLFCAGCVPATAPGPAPAPAPPAAPAPMAGPGTSAPPPAPAAAAVPPQLQPPPPAAILLQTNARGVQIYTCSAKPPGGFEWSFKAPDAILFDGAGRQVARHFAGPSWQANDGSIVVGEAVANVPSPNGVPWLLLRAKTHQGAGIFARVTYIQRLDTNGGTTPALPCGPANLGQEARIPYTATYVLYD